VNRDTSSRKVGVGYEASKSDTAPVIHGYTGS
jgi:hypothetical protein